MIGMLLVGYFAARRVRDTADFVVAGRRLPLWLATSTLLATWMGAGTAMGAAGAAFESGLLGVIADPFGAALCLLLAGMFFVRMMRRMRLLTIVDFFEIKYGDNVALIAALALIGVYVGWTGSQLVAFGFVLHSLTGISTSTGIVIATLIVLAYTTAGGMWAVSLTDFVQLLILSVGFALILPLVLSDLGGWQRVSAAVPAGSFRIIPETAAWPQLLDYLRAWMVIGLGNIPAQDLMQRTLSSKNENVAQNACYLAAIGYITVGMIPVLLGIIGAVALPAIDNPEMIVPELALQHLHALPLTIFLGALLAAIMSSADSALLAPASILGENILPRLAPDLSPRAVLAITRFSVPVIGVASLAIALYAHNVYQLFLDSFSLMLVAMFVPLAAGIWWRQANRAAAAASMTAGVLVWLAGMPLLPGWPTDLFGLAAAALTFPAVALASQRVDPPRPLRDDRGHPVSLRGRLGLLNPFDRHSRLAEDAATGYSP
ncbi:MAG: sodium:solute symporter family protein [Acidobacteriota bacterium]